MSFDRAQGPRGERSAPDPIVARGLLRWLAPWTNFRTQRADPEDQVTGESEAQAPRTRIPSRQGEDPHAWFRCDRIFFQNGGWYIATREGIDVGPYANAASARRDAKHLIKLLTRSSGNGFTEQALIVRQFVDRPRHGH